MNASRGGTGAGPRNRAENVRPKCINDGRPSFGDRICSLSSRLAIENHERWIFPREGEFGADKISYGGIVSGFNFHQPVAQTEPFALGQVFCSRPGVSKSSRFWEREGCARAIQTTQRAERSRLVDALAPSPRSSHGRAVRRSIVRALGAAGREELSLRRR